MEVEEPAERACELQRPRRVGCDRVERRAEIVQLRLERVRPTCFRIEPSLVRGLGEIDEVRGVPFTEVRLLVALGEAVPCELADCPEHREPLAAPAQQAVIDERREGLEHIAANRLRGVEREPAGENRQLREEAARFVVE